MKYCKECKVKINTPVEKCPLCGDMLIGETGSMQHVYPKVITVRREMNEVPSGRRVTFTGIFRFAYKLVGLLGI